jgi:hypothetical protein
MKTNDFSGDWIEKRNKLKHKFPFLTENDLCYGQGKKANMLENLRITLGKSKEEMLTILSLL